MRLARTMAIFALVIAVPLVVGFGFRNRQQTRKIDEVESMVKLVKRAYEGCQRPDAAVIMAEVAIFEMGKKGQIPDAQARLERTLETLETPELRNFTRFLIAASYGEAKQPAKAADVLEAAIAENVARLRGAGTEASDAPTRTEPR